MSAITACIGAGNIGRAWAMMFACAGHEVRLYDEKPEAVERALALIGTLLEDQQRIGLIEDAGAALARIRPAASLEAAVAGAGYVQECVPEELELKRRIFATLDRLAPEDAILASSVSSIPVSAFMENLAGSRRCIGAHPVNPPHLLPVVELVLSPSTSAATFERTAAFLRGLGQVPVRINKEIFGYVLNRLQFALVNEALHLIERGYISAGDVDNIMKYGLGRRWALLGVFEAGHLNADGGLRDYYGKFGALIRTLMSELHLAPNALSPALVERIAGPLEQQTPIEQVPARQAWRDRHLAALKLHLDRRGEPE
jgi:3-hydroxyacyl-CoA dehydrogenase